MILGWLERPLVVRDAFATLDAIAVLGAPLGPGGTLTRVLADRVEAAAELYRAGGGRYVVATGGTTQGATRAEAAALAEALAAAGVPSDAIVVEDRSLTTADNARFTAELLAPLSARRVWLVTHPFHGRRAARLFRRAGLVPSVWPLANSSPKARWIAREYAAWCALLLRGR